MYMSMVDFGRASQNLYAIINIYKISHDMQSLVFYIKIIQLHMYSYSFSYSVSDYIYYKVLLD